MKTAPSWFGRWNCRRFACHVSNKYSNDWHIYTYIYIYIRIYIYLFLYIYIFNDRYLQCMYFLMCFIQSRQAVQIAPVWGLDPNLIVRIVWSGVEASISRKKHHIWLAHGVSNSKCRHPAMPSCGWSVEAPWLKRQPGWLKAWHDQISQLKCFEVPSTKYWRHVMKIELHVIWCKLTWILHRGWGRIKRSNPCQDLCQALN